MFKRKESLNFYSLLIKQAQVIRDAVAALCAYCQDPTQERGDFVKVKEKEADAVRRELVEDINRTFITPIDRDDLYRLSTSIDDLADYAWTTVKELRYGQRPADMHGKSGEKPRQGLRGGYPGEKAGKYTQRPVSQIHRGTL